MFWEACKDFYCIQLDSPLAENKSKNSFFKTPFWSPLKNRRPDLKVCGERSWLPISKMVWHFTICSVVWLLELSKVGCEDLASSEKKVFKKFFLNPFWDPFQNRKPDPKVCGERTWLPIYKMVWHLTIGSAVWMLELSKVGCKVFQRRRGGGGHFGCSPLIFLSQSDCACAYSI